MNCIGFKNQVKEFFGQVKVISPFVLVAAFILSFVSIKNWGVYAIAFAFFTSIFDERNLKATFDHFEVLEQNKWDEFFY